MTDKPISDEAAVEYERDWPTLWQPLPTPPTGKD